MPRTVSRRDLIVNAARERFTTKGYDGTKIGDIAADLGISKAAIAYYFPVKEAFLDEFVSPFLTSLEEALAEVSTPRETLEVYLDAVIADHDVAVWVDTDTTIQAHPAHGERLAAINDVVIQRVTGGAKRKSDRVRALSVLGGIWRPVRELQPQDLRTHREAIVNAALAGY
ncbi:MAG: TetR/AcrR family transcriptional regulator [Acidimicrobiales bacterium]|nr:TetR/AcrR family transcriptional regulator [Acidimicrobiales bacterium]